MKWNKLRVAIVGLGEQTIDNLLPSLFLSQYVTLIAVCDIDKHKLSTIGKRIGITNRYLSYKEMMDSERLDVIVVSSFPDVHYQVAKCAILKGINVFIEKPPASNLAQLNSLIDLASLTSVKTGVGMNFSYTDSHNTLKEIISEADFGKLSFVSVEHVSSKPVSPLWHLDSTLESFLLAQLIHPLDYILSLGGSYRSISVHCSRLYSPFFIQIMLEFEEGIIGCLKSGTFYPRFKHEVEVISSTGNTVTIKDLSFIEVTKIDLPTPFNIKSKNCSTVYTTSPLKSGYSKAGYTSELDAFFENVLFGSKYNHTLADMLPVYEALYEIKTLIHERNVDYPVPYQIPISPELVESVIKDNLTT